MNLHSRGFWALPKGELCRVICLVHLLGVASYSYTVSISLKQVFLVHALFTKASDLLQRN